MKLVLLWSDLALWALVLALLAYALRLRSQPLRRATWRRVFEQPAALCAGWVLLLFLLVALADSVHGRRALPSVPGQAPAYSTRTESLLDLLLAPLAQAREVSYSAPLATRAFTKQAAEAGATGGPGRIDDDGRGEGAGEGAGDGGRDAARVFARLLHGGAHLVDDSPAAWARDVAWRGGSGAAGGVFVALLMAAGLARGCGGWRALWRGHTALPWRAVVGMALAVLPLFGAVAALAPHYHVLGTDRTGNDVLYQALKSLRTAFVIGSLATVATLPLAVGLGILAGYFKGWVDEVIQYLYTVLSSIPNVLLIAACVLMMQVFIDTHPALFETGAERADARLVLLCVILGVTGWATLCRLIRGEALKLRELDYVQAATALGVGPWRIMGRHIAPNVMHLVIITTVLEFSALILYEAVLSYVGVGVDPGMNSFGGMINLARSEMSREPVVWWSFVAAFGFMVALVLAANLFADGVRDAFDPRARAFRVRRDAAGA